jgi:hypothetical protein
MIHTILENSEAHLAKSMMEYSKLVNEINKNG